MNDRPQDDALLALLYDELPPGEAAALREKLAAESPESLDRLTQWQAIRTVVAELPELEPDPQIHYDIIREARRAVDAAEKPSRLWAWLEQLTLMPALAGLLLVVLAAGLTLRLDTDLEQADDSALAPGAATPAASAPAPKGGQVEPTKAAKAVGEKRAMKLDRPIKKAAEAKPALAAATEPPQQEPVVPQLEADPAAADDARAGVIDGVDPATAFGDAAATAQDRAVGKKADARGEQAAVEDLGEKSKRETASNSKKSKPKPRASRRKAPSKKPVATSKDKGGIAGLLDGGDAPDDPAPAEPAPAEPAPVDAPTATPRPAAPPPTDDLFGDLAGAEAEVEVEAKAEQSNAGRGAAVDAPADASVGRRRASTREPADDRVGTGGTANAPAGGATAPRAPAYAPPPPPAPPPDTDSVVREVDEAERADTEELAEDAGQVLFDVKEGQRDEEADRLSRARLLRARGLHREAVDEYEAFLSQSQGSSGLDRVWYEAAESYRALGQEDRALQLYRLVAGGDTAYAARARDRIATLTGQSAGPSKAAGQAAPPRARPAAAPTEADVLELKE